MSKYQVVVVDVDGTLVTTDKRVTQVTQDAIAHVRKQGVLFGVATGRPVSSALKMLKRFKVDHAFDFLVASNGVETLDLKTNQSIKTYQLTKDDFIKIVKDMEACDVDYCLYDKGTVYTSNLNDIVLRIAELNDLKPFVCPIEDLPIDQAHKIVFTIPKHKIDMVQAHKAKLTNPDYSYFFSQEDLFEFVDVRVSKATGIEAYVQSKGLGMEHVVSFGDGENDRDMLQKAGLGVAMANASLAVQAIADDITKSNDDDGVAYYLKKLFNHV